LFKLNLQSQTLPSSIVKQLLQLMGTHFARIGAVVKGEAPFNKDDVAKNAAIVNSMASLPWQGFGPGTEGGDALPNVWSESAKFQSNAKNYKQQQPL
jgi:cytochrome c556